MGVKASMAVVSYRSRRVWLVIAILLAVLAGAMILASGLGAVAISPLSIIKMALNKTALFQFPTTWPAVEETIIFQLRLPRVVGGALVGAALATAGVLFQGLFRNPMADPYIIGTSGGAAFGSTLAMLLPLSMAFYGFGMVPLAAFAGALLTVLLVYNLARIGARTPIVSMLLAGFAVNSMLVAAMYFLLTVSESLQLRLHQVLAFLLGGVAVSDWRQVAVIAPLVVGGILLSLGYARYLNAFSVGEEGAAHLGIDVERHKLIILALGSLLTAAAVCLSGLVGFVGLVMPHAVRLVLGPDHRLLLPASALAGAIFLVIADLCARTLLAPTELPVGVLTALVGAPVFIYLLRRTRREYAF